MRERLTLNLFAKVVEEQNQDLQTAGLLVTFLTPLAPRESGVWWRVCESGTPGGLAVGVMVSNISSRTASRVVEARFLSAPSNQRVLAHQDTIFSSVSQQRVTQAIEFSHIKELPAVITIQGTNQSSSNRACRCASFVTTAIQASLLPDKESTRAVPADRRLALLGP